jgi:RES domain-containing protein
VLVRLWRISDFVDLSGEGGLLEPARWHFQLRRVVYLADHPASALLEVIAHLEVDVEDIPDSYQLFAVDAADEISFDVIEREDLPPDWTEDPTTTQDFGDRWLASNRTALLRVPSAIGPFAWNWLLNPLHVDWTRAHIGDIVRARFDPRLFKSA